MAHWWGWSLSQLSARLSPAQPVHGASAPARSTIAVRFLGEPHRAEVAPAPLWHHLPSSARGIAAKVLREGPDGVVADC